MNPACSTARTLIQQLAAQADVVLSFEPTQAGKESLVLGTAGIVYYKVAVKGLAAHGGGDPRLGVYALVEASDIVLRTMDLDDKANNLRFNWTVAKAGAVPNIIPDQASLEANIRYSRSEDLDKLQEELAELAQELFGSSQIPHVPAGVDSDRIPDEPIQDPAAKDRAKSALGDLLFVLANIGRRWGINPEEALRKSNAKFSRRFKAIESAVAAQGKTLKDVSLIEMEEAYQAAKRKEK